MMYGTMSLKFIVRMYNQPPEVRRRANFRKVVCFRQVYTSDCREMSKVILETLRFLVVINLSAGFRRRLF